MRTLSAAAILTALAVTGCRRIPLQPSPFPPEVRARESLRADTGQASVTTDDYSGTVPPAGPLHFQPDTAALTIESRDVLARFAAWAASRPCRIRIEAHPDDLAAAALADRRARVVADYLVALGVAASRLDTITYGDAASVSASIQRSNSSIARSAGAE